MPRNGSGTYTLPEAAFIPGTSISSAAVNSDYSDIATALTGSLARDGQGGMTAVLPLFATGFTYVVDTDTGMYRSAANTQRIKTGGTDIVEISSAGLNILTGGLLINSVAVGGVPLGVGTDYWGASAPALWMFSYGQAISRTTYAALFAIYGTTYGIGDGSTTFNVPDKRGRASFGKDNMGGSAANRITTAGSSVDGTTLGAAGGAQNIVVQQANLANFNLTIGGSMSGTTNEAFGVFAATISAGGTDMWRRVGTSQPVAVPTTGLVVSSGGSSTALNKLPPGIICNYIIFAGA